MKMSICQKLKFRMHHLKMQTSERDRRRKRATTAFRRAMPRCARICVNRRAFLEWVMFPALLRRDGAAGCGNGGRASTSLARSAPGDSRVKVICDRIEPTRSPAVSARMCSWYFVGKLHSFSNL